MIICMIHMGFNFLVYIFGRSFHFKEVKYDNGSIGFKEDIPKLCVI